MSCELSNKYIMRHFDGNLNDIENAQLKHHLKSCDNCKQYFEDLNDIFSIMKEEREIEPPQDFTLNVMKKVNTLELQRKKKSDKILGTIYGFTTVTLVFIAMFIAMSIREITIFDAIEKVGSSFSSVSSLTFTLYGLFKILYTLITSGISMIFQMIFIIVKTYYYIFAMLLLMLLIVQKVLINIVKQGEGGIR